MEKTIEFELPSDLRKKLEAAKPISPTRRPWADWEKAVVVRYGPKLGPDGLVPFLPGRTRDAIYNVMLKLGVKHTGVAK